MSKLSADALESYTREELLEYIEDLHRDVNTEVDSAHSLRNELENIKDASSALEMSRERYVQLFDLAPVGYLCLDQHTVIHHINMSALAMIEEDHGRCIDYPFARFVPMDLRSTLRTLIYRCAHNGQAGCSDITLNSGRHVQLNCRPYVDAANGKKLAWATLTDVTERKLANNNLLQAHALVAAIIESATDPIWLVDLDHNMLVANQEYYRLNGDFASDAKSLELHPRAERVELHKWWSECYARAGSGEVLRLKRAITVNGAVHHYEIFFSPAVNDAKVTGVVVVARNVTREYLHELALETSKDLALEREQKLRLTMESMPQIVWTASADGSFRYFNHRWYELIKRGIEESPALWTNYLHDEDKNRVSRTWNASVRTGEILEVEARILRATTQEYVWHIARAVPIHDNSGVITSWIGTFTDINDKRRDEEQSRFITDSSQALMDCIDLESIFKVLGGLLVPAHADWLSIDLLDEAGVPQRVLSLHHDAKKLQSLKQIREEAPLSPTSSYGYTRVLRTGRPQLISPITSSILEQALTSKEYRRIAQNVGLKAMMCVPLVCRGRVIGCVTVAITEKRRLFDQRDLLLAEKLMNSLAIAIDNARLLSISQPKEVRQKPSEGRS